MTFRTTKDQLKTSSLFYETKYDSVESLYSLSDKDKVVNGRTIPSLYKLYTNMADVTEYTFANTYMESYQHWDLLCGEEFFKPYIQRWRKELELKLKSEALVEIIRQTKDEDPRKRMEASKYLYEKVFVGDKQTKGRPSKAQIKEEAHRQAKEAHLIDSHWKDLVVGQTNN